MNPICRLCGRTEDIITWPDEGEVICPKCCEKAEHPDGESGHQFSYEKGEGWICKYCGINRNYQE